MTQNQAEEYLRALGHGSLENGIDVANAAVAASNVTITGNGIFRDHKPICHTAWRQVYGYQLAVVHWALAGYRTLPR